MNTAENKHCFLCEENDQSKDSKTLYEKDVCNKCYFAFANRRQFAFVIDFIVFRGILFLFALLVGYGVALFRSTDLALNHIKLVLELIMWPIFLIKDGFDGQSLGKKLMGLQVIREDTGEPADFPDSFKRNLPILIPFMPIIIAINLSKGKRFGDGWAKTKVIWDKYRHRMQD